MRIAMISSAALLLAGPASAEPAGSAEVSPVVIMPPASAPKLTSTYPAQDEAVTPGVLVMRVTFDQAMLKSGFDFTPAASGEFPQCLKTPRLLADGKTFVLLCRTRPSKTYGLAFNAKGAGGFANIADQRAPAATLSFSTTSDSPVVSLDDALKVAKLGPMDVPVQETPDRRPEAAK